MADREQAREVQEQVSRICNEQIVPGLLKICDRLTQNGEHVRVDKLEINIGAVKNDEIGQQLASVILKQFDEQLRQLVLSGAIQVNTARDNSANKVKHQAQTGRKKTEVLAYYLRYGSLPWWNPNPEIDIQEYINEHLKDDSNALWEAVKNVLQLPVVQKRFMQLAAPRRINAWLVSTVSANIGSLNEVLWQMVSADGRLSISLAEWQALFCETMLGHMAVTPESLLPEDAAVQLLRSIREKYNLPQDTFEQNVQEMMSSSSLFTPQVWEQILKKVDEAATEHQARKEELENSTRRKKLLQADASFIEVSNAGLVLLWPYLERLFGHLGYIEDAQFAGDEARRKAVHLLHFISTGKTEGKEHEWPLNKLMCGLSPETYISEEEELKSNEIQEARAMMKAAIGHWEALKGTSVTGLRETFLHRAGIITPDPNGWKVQVERETYDILLNRLPWPLSIINLPWNEHILYVQW